MFRQAHGRNSAIYFSALSVAICLLLAGCGGGSSGGSGGSPAPTITSVVVSCSTGTVPINQTDQCNVTVQGTGNFNSSVNWSVSGVAGGNSTVGTINSAGLYAAPGTVPTPFTITVTATSVANSAVSGSASLVIAGTIASVTQTISAASGGTITLPDGSNVSIAAGVLPADEDVTLSEVSVLPKQPPNPAITSVGAGLILSFSSPILFPAAAEVRANPSSLPTAVGATASTAPEIQFSLSTTTYNQALLQNVQSSLPFADFTTSSGSDNFMGLVGGFVSASNTFIGSTESSLLAGLSVAGSTIQSVVFGAANLATSVIHLFQTPTRLSFDFTSSKWQTNQNWTSADCPSGRTLVLVHGMFSTVEDSFGPAVVGEIEKGSSNYYQSVVGFDYNWLQSITQSGAQLATFLNDLGACNIGSLDIEAHSEGVPVSMSALIQSVTKVNHLISVGGPIMGTPAADDTRVLQTIILDWTTGLNLPAGITLDLASILASPFVSDLTTGSTTLSSIRSSLASNSEKDTPQFVVVGGDNPEVLGILSPIMKTTNFDGVVPFTSALAFDSGLKVYPVADPLALFMTLGHTDLVSNPGVQSLVISQVRESAAPSLSCTNSASNCVGAQGTTFTFTGNGFSSSASAVQIFSQDSTGAVTLQLASLLDNGGSITWSTTPGCSYPIGLFSVFSFDNAKNLASNNVMQTIDAGNCGSGGTNPVPSISSLSPSSAGVGSAAQTLTINGNNFLNSSAVSFNGSIRSSTFVSGTQLTISLTASDLASAGKFPVSVTNPAPGGGLSNVANFTVATASPGSVSLSPTSVSVPEGGAQTFSASVVGSSSGVTWSVQEGTAGGAIASYTSTSAIYLPPSTTGTFHIVATSIGNTAETATATVTVVAPMTLTVLHSFQGSDGAWPTAGLIQASDGNFYGTTSGAGASDAGTVFKVDTAGNPTVLHSFSGSDGGSPNSGLIQANDGNFYGTTFYGGTYGHGAAFKMDSLGKVTLLYSFSDPGPANPYAGLIQALDGNFYGTTYYGGPSDAGTAYRMDTSGNVTLLHPFSSSDGAPPYAGLVQASDRNFYGTTYYGGAGGGTGGGTVFKMDAAGNVTVLHSFSCTDGCGAIAGLIQGNDGYLYGTTLGGGAFGDGTIFKIDTSGHLTVLHSFSSLDGWAPYASLIQGSDGNFYGTTAGGGASGAGTIFRMDPAGNVTVLHSFSNVDGAMPEAGVIFGKDGKLYGTAYGGGAASDGVVFRLD